MENTTSRSWPRALYLPVLAVGVALVAAVSSWASSPASTTPAQSSAPAAQEQVMPIQDTQTTPAEPDGDRRAPGGREDCPEKDGAGEGAGSGDSGSAAPQSAAPDDSGSDTQV